MSQDEPFPEGDFAWIPPGMAERQLREEVAALRAKVEELEARLAMVEKRTRRPAPIPRGVPREEASTIGAEFWAVVTQGSGPKKICPVKVRVGMRDEDGDGNIAYRVERTDEDVKQGSPLFRRPDELFRTKEDCEAAAHPRRMSGQMRRPTIKPT